MKIYFICFLVCMFVGCKKCCQNEKYLTGTAQAKVYTTEIRGRGKEIGQVNFRDVTGGVLVDVELKGVSKGEHGFHIHEFGDCRASFHRGGNVIKAGKAGGHWDFYKTNKHLGPNGGGHIGDLPKLEVVNNGEIIDRFFIENINVEMIRGKSIIVHEGGDNYKDEPVLLGGGGNRFACGLIE